MKGLIIYQKRDYERNCDYVKWMCEVGRKKGCLLNLMFLEDFFANGLKPDCDVDFVINRSRSYEASLIFELNNVRVFNSSCITLLGNNKLAAYKYAKDKGFRFPEVYMSWKGKNNVLSKPVSGHGGIGISMLEDVSSDDRDKRLNQEYIKNTVGDARFYIINNKIVHAVLRRANGRLVSNFSRGGVCEIFKYSNSQEETVKRFIEDISIDYAGVDFLVTCDGELIFNEIEDVVGSRMLSFLGINNTTDLYIDYIVNEIGKCK
ncbi:MAG: ATP-grasp domain-containing protein [Clostridiaceae bacterium]|jgi:gamma-F420-2:alpha-L-glutamate ligase|nr:ATP-grasp domain-containing protein [Clostridiaceae bacterium]